jgi:hypothetical protein
MKIEAWHRRHALYVASHLPDNPDDARIVLKLLGDLVDNFIADESEPKTERANVVTLVKGSGG